MTEIQSEVDDIIGKVKSRPNSDLSPGLMSDEEEHEEQPYHPEPHGRKRDLPPVCSWCPGQHCPTLSKHSCYGFVFSPAAWKLV